MVNFDESTHTYTNEKGDKLISVTTLLRWAGISPSYDGVDTNVLQAAASRGSLIHKEIEDYIKKGEIGFTVELDSFIKYIKENDIEILASEKMVYNENVAGTIDLIIRRRKTNKVSYVDFKTTYTTYMNSVSWQLSLYKDLDNEYPDADLETWHFLKDGTLEIKNANQINKEAISDLYSSYLNGKKYEIKAEENDLMLLYEAEKIVAYFEKEKAQAEERAKTVRAKIVESMKAAGITKFENEHIIISYIAPTTAEVFDSKRFKAEQPEEYAKYTKTQNKSEQVRIKLKEESFNEEK